MNGKTQGKLEKIEVKRKLFICGGGGRWDIRSEKKFGRNVRVSLDGSLCNSQRSTIPPGRPNNGSVRMVLRKGSYAFPAVKLRVSREERLWERNAMMASLDSQFRGQFSDASRKIILPLTKLMTSV